VNAAKITPSLDLRQERERSGEGERAAVQRRGESGAGAAGVRGRRGKVRERGGVIHKPAQLGGSSGVGGEEAARRGSCAREREPRGER